MKKRLGIIFGGRSEEHEVSIMSTKSVVDNINRDKYEIELFAIDKAGRPYYLSEADLRSDRIFIEANSLTFGEFADIVREKTDVIFPTIHGPYGEDGRLQGFLDMIGVKYVGCGMSASSVCMDKAFCKHILQNNNFRLLPFKAFYREDYEADKEQILSDLPKELGFPIFVKPSNLGSSVGITKAHDVKELEAAIDYALKFDRYVVCEKGINARELECGVLGLYDLIPTAVGEVVPSNEFYDYEAKYSEEALSDIIIPADISKEDEDYIKAEAKRACKLLSVRGLSRVDFLKDKDDGVVYVSEINTIPGFTKYSMYPGLAKVIGYSYSELIDELVEIALK